MMIIAAVASMIISNLLIMLAIFLLPFVMIVMILILIIDGAPVFPPCRVVDPAPETEAWQSAAERQ